MGLLKLHWQTWPLIPTSLSHSFLLFSLSDSCNYSHTQKYLCNFRQSVEMPEIYKLMQVLLRRKLVKNTFPHHRSKNLLAVLSEDSLRTTYCLFQESSSNGFMEYLCTRSPGCVCGRELYQTGWGSLTMQIGTISLRQGCPDLQNQPCSGSHDRSVITLHGLSLGLYQRG